MENKRLYHIILRNYPDILPRRKSEINLNADTPPSDAAIEPAVLPVEIRAKKHRISESENHKRKDEGDSKITDKGAGEGAVKKDTDNDKTAKDISPNDSQPAPVAPRSIPGWFRQISTMSATDHHYLRDMPLYKNTMMHRGAMMSIPRYRLKASSLPDMFRNSMESLDSLTDDEMVSAYINLKHNKIQI